LFVIRAAGRSVGGILRWFRDRQDPEVIFVQQLGQQACCSMLEIHAIVDVVVALCRGALAVPGARDFGTVHTLKGVLGTRFPGRRFRGSVT
jgi:hypothetical protein